MISTLQEQLLLSEATHFELLSDATLVESKIESLIEFHASAQSTAAQPLVSCSELQHTQASKKIEEVEVFTEQLQSMKIKVDILENALAKLEAVVQKVQQVPIANSEVKRARLDCGDQLEFLKTQLKEQLLKEDLLKEELKRSKVKVLQKEEELKKLKEVIVKDAEDVQRLLHQKFIKVGLKILSL